MTEKPYVVIQGSRRSNSVKDESCDGYFKHEGKKVKFVTQPDLAPDDDFLYALPDDTDSGGVSWREKLTNYNREFRDSGKNPYGLLPAWKIYQNKIYEDLKNEYGEDRLYILLAGWGIVRADFLIPASEITFTVKLPNNYNLKDGFYRHYNMLPDDAGDPVVFFGRDECIPLFCDLTGKILGKRYAFYKGDRPDAPCCELREFRPSDSNPIWYYETARKFIENGMSMLQT